VRAAVALIIAFQLVILPFAEIGAKMTDEEFGAFVDSCYDELEAKQDVLNGHGLGAYERYFFDQETSRLQFLDGDEIKKEFPVVVIGTWAHQKNDWLWGWANESLLEPLRTDSAACKQLAEITGFDFASKPRLDADENMAYELAAMATHVLSAIGMYRIPGEKSHTFLALL
jgi:hypothetical protein